MISCKLLKKSIIYSILIFFLAITAVHAAASNTAVPSTMGGTTSSVGTDPNTGAANINIPIEVPPGRNGMAPNLALTYNSNKRNGWIGVGWDIKTSFIQRNTKRGVNYSKNDYVADGNRELVARGDWGTGYYGHKREGAFIKYYYNGSGGWTATTKDGTKHYYGTTAASRQDDTADSTRVFKWMIDKVEDTNGNYITYSYTKDKGEIYLDKISYTGGTGLSPAKYIKFYYETRTDIPVMYTSNFSVKTAKRLITIQAVSGSSTVRAYKLVYDADPDTTGSQYSSSTGRSVLYSVQQYGSDTSVSSTGAVSGGSCLPATTFTHQQPDNGFTQTVCPLNISREENARILVQGDFNGDGKTDFLSAWTDPYSRISDSNTQTYVYLSDGDGTFTKTLYPLGISRDANAQILVQGDFNGDGKTDFLTAWTDPYGRISDSNTQTYVYLSDGDGTFTKTLCPLGISRDGNAQIPVQGDFNGDGKTDFITAWTDPYGRISDSNTQTYVYLSDGDGTFTKTLCPLGISRDGNAQIPVQGDFNGDGKTDFITAWTDPYGRISDANTQTCVYISKGDGTFTKELCPLGISIDANARVQAQGDFNGDGRSDFLTTWSDPYGRISDGNTQTYAYLSDGDGTFTRVQYSMGISSDGNACIQAQGDYNGDGKTEFITTYADSSGRICQSNTKTCLHQAKPLIPDLITSVDNGVGGTTTIAYKPSTTYDNTQLPFNVNTVSSITVSDGKGNSSKTSYTYSKGYHDIQDREFRGFGYVKATDPAGTITESWFKQDDVYKGLPYKEQTKDSSGNLYSKTENTYSSTTPNTGVKYPYLTQRDDYIYDGTSTAKKTKTTFTYDSYGNTTLKKLYGDTSVSGDERDEYTEYDYDTTNWIVSLPDHTYIKNSAGTKVSEAWYTYDSAGNLLTDTRWLSGGTNPVITYTYNTYGNQTSIKDPRGNTTTITYDSTYIYPKTATNPLSQTATTIYNNLYGKISSETDPNGNTTTYTYDALGRLTKVTGPLDTASTYGTVTYEYQDCGDANLRIVTYRTEEHGTANYLRSEDCLDGLERRHKSWREGPDGKTIYEEIEYDSSGRVKKKTLPYFTNGTKRWTTYTYDPIGRVTKVTNPDSTYTTTSYSKGTTTYTDANGHKKVEIKDVYGRLITVKEYTGSSGAQSLYATTTYEYNAPGNLIKLTDAKSNVTTMTYDTLGRKKTMSDPDMGDWSYSYDANGNLTSQTDPKNQTITHTYDKLNRITKKDYPLGTDTTYTYDQSFSTQPKGRLTTLTDSTGNTKYYYDKLGRTTKTIKTVTNGVTSSSYTTETTYDALGRTKSVTYPDSETVNYTYDTGGNLSSVKSTSTTYASYSGYNALGQTGGITYGNGIETAYTYNADNGLLKTIDTETSSGTDLINRSYTFDNTGNITYITDNVNSANTQSFTYDALDRLTNASSTSYGSLTYAYDTIGNFTSKRGVTYTYSSTTRPHAVTATSNGKTYTYDDNGNMTADTDRTISYNYDNKPGSITKGSTTALLYYDGTGARVKKQTGTTTTIYIGKLYEKKGTTTTRYIFAGATRIASIVTSGSTDSTYYYHQDHLGSSSVITNASGTKVEEVHYYPFGETRTDTGSYKVSHKFTSQELDIETGLYYYNARYYNPVLGRFISADTLVPDPTNPQALNRYSYVLNNPIKYTDPSGHGAWDWIKKTASKAWKKVTSIFTKPEKVFEQNFKQATSFSIENIVNAGIDAGLRYIGVDPNGPLGLTIKAVAEQGVKQLTSKAYEASERDSQRSSHNKVKAPSMPFYGKNPNNRGKTHHRLANHGLVDSNPYLADNYNPEDAVWRLMNAVQSTSGKKEIGNSSQSNLNTDLIMGGSVLIGKGVVFIAGTFTTPAIIVTGPVGLVIVGIGAYTFLAGLDIVPSDPWDLDQHFPNKGIQK